jgi:hypothetical protein
MPWAGVTLMALAYNSVWFVPPSHPIKILIMLYGFFLFASNFWLPTELLVLSSQIHAKYFAIGEFSAKYLTHQFL